MNQEPSACRFDPSVRTRPQVRKPWWNDLVRAVPLQENTSTTRRSKNVVLSLKYNTRNTKRKECSCFLLTDMLKTMRPSNCSAAWHTQTHTAQPLVQSSAYSYQCLSQRLCQEISGDKERALRVTGDEASSPGSTMSMNEFFTTTKCALPCAFPGVVAPPGSCGRNHPPRREKRSCAVSLGVEDSLDEARR